MISSQSVTVSADGSGGPDIVAVIGYSGAAIAFVVGLIQYRRAQRWKRAEFIANEAKEYFANPLVKNALMMIDWAQRQIPLSSATNATTCFGASRSLISFYVDQPFRSKPITRFGACRSFISVDGDRLLS